MSKDDFEGYLGHMTPGVKILLRSLAHRLSGTVQMLSDLPDPENEKLAEQWLANSLSPNATDHMLSANSTRYKQVSCQAGEVLIKEGAQGDMAYIITKGRLEVSRLIEGRKIFLNVLQERDVVGEMAILRGNVRHATVTAITDCELLGFGKREVIHMARHGSVELFIIMDALSAKLEQTNEFYGKTQIKLEKALQRVNELEARVKELETK